MILTHIRYWRTLVLNNTHAPLSLCITKWDISARPAHFCSSCSFQLSHLSSLLCGPGGTLLFILLPILKSPRSQELNDLPSRMLRSMEVWLVLSMEVWWRNDWCSGWRYDGGFIGTQYKGMIGNMEVWLVLSTKVWSVIWRSDWYSVQRYDR